MANEHRLSIVFRRTFTAFRRDHATRFAAALSYYAIFSIVPMLLIVISATGLVLGRGEAQREIHGQLSGVLGTAASDAIYEMLKSAAQPKAGVIATLVGAIAFVFGMWGAFGELRGALNAIWKTDDGKGHVLSYLMVAGIAALLMVSLLFDGGITTIGGYANRHFLGGVWLWKSLQLIISIVVATALFAVVFRFLPPAKVKWTDVFSGAAFTAVLFVLGKFALGMYLWTAAVGSNFGAAGSIIVVLVWIYWSVLIFLFGVEFTHAYAMGDVVVHDSSSGGSV